MCGQLLPEGRKRRRQRGRRGRPCQPLEPLVRGRLRGRPTRRTTACRKRCPSPPGEKLPKKSSPSKLKHGVGKRLMTTLGPVTQEPDCHLITHKDYAVEMMESIINDKDVDPCAEQVTEELGALGLFDLAQVCCFLSFSIYPSFCLIANDCFVL